MPLRSLGLLDWHFGRPHPRRIIGQVIAAAAVSAALLLLPTAPELVCIAEPLRSTADRKRLGATPRNRTYFFNTKSKGKNNNHN